MNSSNFFKLGATSFEGGNKATPRPQNTKSKSSPNLPTDKLSAADQLAAESQAVFDAKLSQVLDEKAREMLKKEQELKLHPDGGQFGRLDLPAFHPDQLRGGQSRVDEALGMGRQRGGEGLDEKLEPKLLVARIMELEQYVGRLEQQFEELFQREQEHQHTKELLAIAMEKLRRLGVDPSGQPRRPFASGQNSIHHSPDQVLVEQLRFQQEYDQQMARLSARGSPHLDRPRQRHSPFGSSRSFHGPSSMPRPRMFPPAGTRPIPRASPYDAARDPFDLYA